MSLYKTSDVTGLSLCERNLMSGHRRVYVEDFWGVWS